MQEIPKQTDGHDCGMFVCQVKLRVHVYVSTINLSVAHASNTYIYMHVHVHVHVLHLLKILQFALNRVRGVDMKFTQVHTCNA